MMQMSNDRARITGLAVLAVLGLAGCPKKNAVVAPPVPPGDALRLVAKAGDKVGGNVKIRLEKTDVGGKKKPRTYAFQLEEEHVFEKVDPSGSMHVTAKFFNVEAQGDTPKEKKAGEDLARALSDMQIAYDVTTRGDVTNFEVKNVPDGFMSEARLIGVWVYGAERGPMFDAGPIEAGKGWQTRAQIPIPAGGSKNWEIDCSYAKKEKNLAYVTLAGKVTGESQGTQLTGEIKGEVRVDVARGGLTFQEMDSQSTFRTGESGGQQIHIHVTWEAQAPAGGAASAEGQSGDAQAVSVMK
ncbi:MAG: hypothetical protein JNJ46_10255 [Myxococcales bacterium]|nr:hypothetical protein [Myxococcales bacterium]